ncbi:MAG TPA: transketolase [Xanthobacteraceae bacterium]|nr:transketolase [Xanthobacteraceae bacterium]
MVGGIASALDSSDEKAKEVFEGQGDADRLCIDTIRTLAMDAVEKAKSGHPGTPMGLAPAAYTLWQQALRYDCDDPNWPNRDRFVLSNGHASMLLYALLHLSGVKDEHGNAAVSLDDIKQFRQLGSLCPGHPEFGHIAGVEITTGPLGQGCGNSVGMAIAGQWLAATYNRPSFRLIDYDVYAFCSDGDMMEGVSGEAASLAGHLQLPNLCWIYDNNHVTIEGHTSLAFSEDVAARFRGYGWDIIHLTDANNIEEIGAALVTFRRTIDRPTLIILDSHIGYGAPHKQDTSAAHGEPLGTEEVRLAKRFYGWPEDATFFIPDGVYDHFRRGIGERGRQLHQAWQRQFESYRSRFPELAAEFEALQRGEAPSGWEAALPSFKADAKGLATRESSGKVLNAVAPHYPWLLGGAADLAPSTKTLLTFEGAGNFESGEWSGRNLHFGIREHAMGCALNGLAVSRLRPFGATFLIFSDYMKPSIRLAALMQLPVIYVFTHDSIGLGEDGPTHQPVEQLAGLRAIPDLVTIRPADANEVVEAWRMVLRMRNRPAALVLSRQPLPTLDRSIYASASALERGAYVLRDTSGRPDVILIGTGSEVSLCITAANLLDGEGIRVRVVSMPSCELFNEQEEAYRESVLPSDVLARVSVEAASVLGWERYVGPRGAMVGMTGFGASAPLKDIMSAFGFTAEHVVQVAKAQIGQWARQ